MAKFVIWKHNSKYFKFFLKKIGLFLIYFRLLEHTLQILQQMSFQDTVLGFELTTFVTWVFSHNH